MQGHNPTVRSHSRAGSRSWQLRVYTGGVDVLLLAHQTARLIDWKNTARILDVQFVFEGPSREPGNFAQDPRDVGHGQCLILVSYSAVTVDENVVGTVEWYADCGDCCSPTPPAVHAWILPFHSGVLRSLCPPLERAAFKVGTKSTSIEKARLTNIVAGSKSGAEEARSHIHSHTNCAHLGTRIQREMPRESDTTHEACHTIATPSSRAKIVLGM